jgi:lipopolysaccharide heptosyltransferase II
MNMEPIDWEKTRRILCVRLDTLGDVLMTTPALRALKELPSHPHLTLLTSASGAEAAALVPEIDDVMVYAAPWMKTAPRRDSAPEFALAAQLRRGGFDAAVIFTVFSQSPLPAAMMCHLADIPIRVAHCHENPYHLLSHWVRDPEPAKGIRHEVQRHLDLVATLGAKSSNQRLSMRCSPQAAQRVRGLLGGLGLNGKPNWAVIHAGATAPSRRYPPESFAAAAGRLVRDAGYQVVFTGAPGELDLIEGIRASMAAPSHSLVGQLALEELAALLAEAPLLISNNTGPVHVAAAVGTPVVVLYALTNPQHTPWGVPCRVLNHDVPCKYCFKSVCPEGHHDCLRRVPPSAVVAAACDLLRQSAAHS